MNYFSKYFYLILLGFILLRLPNGVSPSMSKLFDYSIVLFFLISSFYVITHYPVLKKNAKYVYILQLILPSLLLFSRFINGYSITIDSIIKGFMYPVMLINLFTVFLVTDFWKKLKSIDLVLTIYVVINFLTILLYPDGWFSTHNYSANWFLGYKNELIRTLLPALTINGVLAMHNNGRYKLKNIIIYLICLSSIILTGSATSLVMIIAYGGFVLIVHSRFSLKYFSLLLSFLISCFISIGFVIYHAQDDYSVIFENWLGKDTTLTGRVFIWEYAISKILNSPIIGYGYHATTEWNQIFYDYRLENLSHPHNYLLYTLIQGGVVYLLIYIILLLFTTISTWKLHANREFLILTAMFFLFYIGGISESITNCPLMFPLLGLYITLYNIITNENEKNRNCYSDKSI